MASNTAQTVFTGNAAQLEAEYKKIEAAKDRDIAKLKQQLEASKRAANEEIKLKHDIARAIEAARTPAEKYNQTLAKYKKALQDGVITQEQFNRLRDVELAQLNKATKATDILTEAKTKNARATESSATAATSWTGTIARAATATGVLLAAVNALADAKRKLRKENEADVFSIDEASRSYAVQAGLTTEAQRIAARDRILKTGRDNAVKPQEAFAAATQLLGSGVEDPRALDFFLKMRASANEQLGKADPRELVEGMSQFLGGMGLEKSFKNFEDLGQRMRGLFSNPESAAVQVGDLSEFAKAAPAMAMSHVSVQDSLALLSVLRGGMPSAAEAATGGRNIATRLAASDATRTGQEALQMMGLKPADVDMVGESLSTALKRLKEASDKLSEEKRNVAMVKLFGAENMGAGLLAINNVDKMERIAKSQVNREAFNAGVAMATTGVAADMRRAEADKAIAATVFEGQIAGRAIIDKQVETERLKAVMGRSGLVGNVTTLLETGIDVPILGNIGANSLIDNAAELGLTEQSGRASAVQTTGKLIGGALNPFASRTIDSTAIKQAMADPLMQEQNAILRGLGQKLDKLAPAPGVRPNPATVGRPD